MLKVPKNYIVFFTKILVTETIDAVGLKLVYGNKIYKLKYQSTSGARFTKLFKQIF